MKILALPLDIRPYNYDFLQSLAAMDDSVELLLPEKSELGLKKTPARFEVLNQFLAAQCDSADALVISMDMFLYGGLFPARTHHYELATLLERLETITTLKAKNPALKVYASSLVLRTPKYNSSVEEPEYYATCGKAIFWYGYLTNKQKRVGLTETEQQELNSYRQQIDDGAMEDWLKRRSTNLSIIHSVLKMVQQGIIESLIIPLDDTAEFGFTAQDQEAIFNWINEYEVQDRVSVHPGTDESGCTLLTRAYLDASQQPFKCRTLWSNELFRQVIPNYEDRPFIHSLRSHARACGIQLVDSKGDDLPVLAINGCGEVMQEAFEVSYGYCVHTQERKPKYKNVTYFTHRDLASFADEVKAQSENITVVVADLAHSNGGETDLIRALDKAGALDGIKGYSGWNTTCNSLGSALAALVFASRSNNPSQVNAFLKERLVSDWAYQTEVRFPVELDYLPELGVGYGDFDTYSEQVFARIKENIEQVWQQHIRTSFKSELPLIQSISAPFKRMSGLNFVVQ